MNTLRTGVRSHSEPSNGCSKSVGGGWFDRCMTLGSGLLPASQVLAEIDALLDRLEPVRAGLCAMERLVLVRLARRVGGRVDALASLVTAEADQAHAAEKATGAPLGSWLGMGETLSRREAAGVVRQARTLGGHPV